MIQQPGIPGIAAAAMLSGLLACGPLASPTPTAAPPTQAPTLALTNTSEAAPQAEPPSPEPVQPSPAETPTQPPAADASEPEPAAGPEPQPPAFGEAIYQTDFSVGWPELSFNSGAMAPASGGLAIEVSDLALWTVTTRMAEADFYAEVLAEPITCPAGAADYGIAFHYASDADHKAFVIHCGQLWTLLKRDGAGGPADMLAEGSLPPNIDGRTGEHRIGVLSSQGRLSLYVDDYLMANLVDDSAKSGDFGPFVQVRPGGEPASVLFKALNVYNAR